ncbi:MAG: proline dehydrogenase family protein, partial [Bdellovibrionaceae bacterium]|nr:proline dehydrogenase family protein [Pseudobdellovibrionaceae bacterium]
MQDLQSRIQSKGEEILRRMEGQGKASLFSKDFWYGSIMDWSMRNEKFKTNMFRFVDVLPSLSSGSDVAKHLKEYFEEGGEMPGVFKVGLGLGSLAPGLMAGTIRKNITEMAKMFITGENPQEALPILKKARKNRLTFTVDILGEATLSEKEALEYQRKYLELIDWLARDAETWEEIPQLDRDADGPIPKVNVSVKMTAVYSQINDKAWEQTKSTLKERLRPIFRLAMQKNVFLNLDMEHYAVKHLTLEMFKELLLEPEFRNYRFFGCVVQAYLRDSLKDVHDLVSFARDRGTPFTIRLVKGAYWDSETIEAEQRNWPIPVYTNKAETDANYEACARYLLDNYKHIRVAIASHNVRSIAAALTHAEQLKLPKEAIEIQMLYGMAEPIKKALADMGYRVREYAPVGELIPGMAYLVRRLLENTSNESWLRGKFAEGKTTAELLQDPASGLSPSSEWPEKKNRFYNEPLVDYAQEDVRKKTLTAIESVRKTFPARVQPIVNGQPRETSSTLRRENPSKTSEIVAEVILADRQTAEDAIKAAKAFFPEWRRTPAETRAAYLDKMADIMSQDRYRLAAVQILECGKPWSEADADVAEAIDFCRYYARHMRQLAKGLRTGGVPGEITDYVYRPRGVSVVISPWNFPLAIICGQVVASLVTGNTVIMKPAEQSSLMASYLYNVIRQAGIPVQAVQFLPGLGEEVGAFLVDHPDTAIIAFTGSKAVGLHILKSASHVHPGQKHVKRCIIEMGGKNAIIIDNDADLDEAVDGVVYSAFGFAGQKCSAGSRCIVLDEVYDRFVERLVEATRSIKIRSAEDPEAYFGPVVDADACRRILSTIEQAEKKYKLLYKSEIPNGGHFVPATIFGDVPPDAEIAQEEIFGPVLAVIRARDLDHALEIANSTEYALTGGFFSRSPANIAKVRADFEVGNLYINRGCTGAMVDRHPFGGFKMSGIGSKTGGPD